ncbi:MAG TPA: lipopolysaccharide kinase InaA family protein [Myxococcota bacterium]|nr:lipopolysaccharide kinase InaA family protein [Myxococcota bacterium]
MSGAAPSREEAVAFRASRLDWRAEASDAALVRAEIAERLEALESAPGAQVLKRNRVRTVLRVPLSDGRRVIVKRYRASGLAPLFKYQVRRSRARTEWDVGRALACAGIATSVPLAYAERRRANALRDAALVTREIDDALHLNAYIERHLRGDAARDALRASLHAEVARLARTLHDAGFAHGDFHGGNLLITGPPERPRLHVIDLHSVARRRRISRRARWRDLVKLLHSLRNDTTAEERLELVRSYASAGPDVLAIALDAGTLSPRLERAIARVERVRVRSRTARCLVRSTAFDISSVRGVRVHHRRVIDAAEVVALVDAHRRDVSAGAKSVLKSGRRSSLSRQRLGDRTVVVKQYRDLWWERVRNLVRPRALSAWVAGHGLRVRGFDAAEPLALALCGRGIAMSDAFLVMEDLGAARRADHVALARYGGKPAPSRRAEKRALVASAAELVRRLHVAGVYHADLKAVNLFLRGELGDDARFVLADYDRVRLDREVSRRRRIKNLAQLSASVPVCISLPDRLRFFRAYAADDPSALRAWKDWARRIIEACSKKIVVEMRPIE